MVVALDPLELPKLEDGYPIIRVKEDPQLQLAWSVDPSPANVPALSHYLVELVASTSEGDDVAYTSEAIAPGKSARMRSTC